jgi:hypothetical protein
VLDDVPLDDLRLKTRGNHQRPPARIARHAKPFIKGPIPLSWITSAARQSGHAVHVGLAVWYLVGLSRSSTVELRPSVLRAFGVSRFAGYRALDVLAIAGLVEVVRHRGRSPVVTVVVSDVDVSLRDGGSTEPRRVAAP